MSLSVTLVLSTASGCRGDGGGNKGSDADVPGKDGTGLMICGDGVRTGSEECDNGTENSDTRPNIDGDGCSANCRSNETWEHNGSDWVRYTGTGSPEGRTSGAMSFDRQRARAVLFGGRTGGSFHKDTWEWDGTEWIGMIPTAAAPRPASGAAMVCAPPRSTAGAVRRTAATARAVT